MTLLLAESFKGSRITSIEISSKAFRRAKDNLKQFNDRIRLINADIAEYQAELKENYYDVIVWSESIYYLGARISQTALYDLLGKIMGKLKARGLLNYC